MKYVLVLLLCSSFFFATNISAAEVPNEDVHYQIVNDTIQLQWENPLDDYFIQVNYISLLQDQLKVYYEIKETTDKGYAHSHVSKQLPAGFKDHLDVQLIEVHSFFDKLATHEEVPPNKTWTITFNQDVDPQSISKESIFVLNSLGEPVENFFINDGKRVLTILPPPEGYTHEETYRIYITNDIKAVNGSALPNAYLIEFTIEEKENSIIEAFAIRLTDRLQSNGEPYPPLVETKNETIDFYLDNSMLWELEPPVPTNKQIIITNENELINTPSALYDRVKQLLQETQIY